MLEKPENKHKKRWGMAHLKISVEFSLDSHLLLAASI